MIIRIITGAKTIMFKIYSNYRIGIFGATGYGKTYLANYLSKKIMDKGYKIYAYNTNYENLAATETYEPPKLNKTIKDLIKWIIYMRANYEDVILRIEDIDTFFNNGKFLNEYSKYLLDLFDDGRHQGLGVIYTAKLLRYMPLKILSNTELMFIGQYTEQMDLVKVSAMGIDKNIPIHLKKPIFLAYDKTQPYENRLSYVKVNGGGKL